MSPQSVKRLAKNVALHGIAIANELLGAERRYGIRGAYRHRTHYCHFDDTPYTDEYQKEVYQRAARLAQHAGARAVYDVGCGSGYKLIHYLGHFDTIGFDVPDSLEFLRRTYPNRKWEHVPFSDRSYAPADIVICSDVIEHVLDPDELMGFLLAVSKQWLVLSTPDRNREYPLLSRYQLGPPHTDHHIREWSFREFRRYVERFVDVHEHLHSNPTHATQMIVGKIRHRRVQG
jgi:SAM-dependent methyltransferase